MTQSLYMDLRASLSWLLEDTAQLSTLSESSKLEFTKSLTSGVLAVQADRIWHDRRTLASSVNDDLDLTSLARTILGSSVPVSLAKLKTLLVLNHNADAGEDLELGDAASSPFSGPFAGAGSAKLVVPAGGMLMLVHPGDGWPVTAGISDTLRIHNAGSADALYSIVLAGTSV